MRASLIGIIGIVGGVGCAGVGNQAEIPRPMPRFDFTVDTGRFRLIAPGVTYRYVWTAKGPWAIHVLDVDLTRCYTAVAVKGFAGAVGREKTSTLIRNLAKTDRVVGGVNADFFLFAPPGVPTNALISRGRVITGPSNKPVFAIDSAGSPRIDVLQAKGEVRIGATTVPLRSWNHIDTTALTLFDRNFGSALPDTILSKPSTIASWTDTLRVNEFGARRGAAIPERGFALHPSGGPLSSVAAGGVGQKAAWSMTLTPLHPLEAVGGRPVLVRDSVVVPEVDTEGQAGFATSRHPRTAIGIADNGTRLLIVVVDGRQAPYSDGMTLRELANLYRSLGARDAINLDGGGSTTMVYSDPDSVGALRIANRVSDAAGERPVGDALAIVARKAETARSCTPPR